MSSPQRKGSPSAAAMWAKAASRGGASPTAANRGSPTANRGSPTA